MVVDGEMQVNFALDKKLRDDMYPFNKLKGQDCEYLDLPEPKLRQQRRYKLLDTLGITETIGPIQMGLNKPIHFTDVESSTRDIVNPDDRSCRRRYRSGADRERKQISFACG